MLSFLHSPDYTIRQWSEHDIQEWICQTGMESLKHNFIKFNGIKLLNLDKNLLSEIISNKSDQCKFSHELLRLRRVQRKYDKKLIKFKRSSSNLLKICENLILQQKHYSWTLYFINNLSPQISDMFLNLVPHTPLHRFNKFHHNLTQMMSQIIPIITYHLKTKDIISGKTQNLLYFVLNIISWCFNSTKYDHTKIESVITTECWLKSKLMQEILNKFEDTVYVKSNYMVSCGLLMIIASLAGYSTLDNKFNDLFKKFHICTVMNSFVKQYYTSLNHIQISFPFRSILYINGSNNKEIEWMIENTNVLDAILKEFQFGLNKKCVIDMFNYYPDAWDRAIAINILCDNTKFIDLLIKRDIVKYCKKGLRLQQNTNIETVRLYKNLCMILMKITSNPAHFKCFYKCFNLKRLVYYNNDKNKVFWYRLNEIRLNCMDGIDCSDAQQYAQIIFDNVHNFYYQLFKQYSGINDDLIYRIIAYLW